MNEMSNVKIYIIRMDNNICDDYLQMKADGTIDTGVADSYFETDDVKERQIFYAVYNACKDGKNILKK